ncbi:hypothetical protein AVEN_171223-1 [Araneus ventricosus]|uniref:Uncharacterized protein n=1 Tax=Araneus ventricosus TaxID=182803 RepID=A0A4Y2TBF9_ARAVE|nr:hypothetical protein AVEN_171223-1 [Araneus ventricosus]
MHTCRDKFAESLQTQCKSDANLLQTKIAIWERSAETEKKKLIAQCFKIANIVTNMESRFPEMLVLWLGREFYKVKHGVTGSDCSWNPDPGDELGDYFGDK